MIRKRNLLITTLAAVLTLGLATAAAAQTCPEPTPAEELAATMELIGSLELNPGNTNALMQPLSSALINVATGDVVAAVRHLETFENKVDAQSGKALTQADADLLIATAQGIVEALTAPQPEPCPCLTSPEFATLLADFSSANWCTFDEAGTGYVSLAIAFAPPRDGGRSARALPSNEYVPNRCIYSETDGPYLSLSITDAEFLGCQQLLLDTAAAAGVTCVPPPPAP